MSVDLNKAKVNKKDEFYTQLPDIEKELVHYRHHFRGKTVYCNCDDPTVSQFFRYFSLNFAALGLKKLITTCYRNQQRDLFSRHDTERAIMLEYDGFRDGDTVPRVEDIGVTHLQGDGDFRSQECIDILKRADIVVTNPPFSLFREYVSQLMDHDKRFLIIGNVNAATVKDFFPFLQAKKVWFGPSIRGGDRVFGVPERYPLEAATGWVDENGDKFIRVKGVRWFTNLDYRQQHEDLLLYSRYTPDKYPKYDNYDAIEVSEVKEIPMDYDGVMGVPVTFLDKYNPDQFEILGITKTWFGARTKDYPRQIQVGADGKRSEVTKLNDGAVIKVPSAPVGKTYYLVGDEHFVQVYPRLLIRNRKVQP